MSALVGYPRMTYAGEPYGASLHPTDAVMRRRVRIYKYLSWLVHLTVAPPSPACLTKGLPQLSTPELRDAVLR